MSVYTDAGGKVIKTDTFTKTIDAGDSSPIFTLPDTEMRGPWANVKVVHNQIGADVQIRFLHLYYIPGRFRGQRAA